MQIVLKRLGIPTCIATTTNFINNVGIGTTPGCPLEVNGVIASSLITTGLPSINNYGSSGGE